MIISKTPYRLSLFGGGTDFPTYFKEHGPILLIGAGLDQYCYVTVKPLPSFARHKYEVYYSHVEKVDRIDQIQNPGVRGTLEFVSNRYDISNIAIYIQNSLPSQSGVGSSSAMIVGLLNALYHYLGFQPSKRQLALDAIHIERVVLAEPGGWQDEIFCAYGNVSSLEIGRDEYFNVRPLPVSEDFLVNFKKSCVLLYLGAGRNSFEISTSYENKDADIYKHQIQEISKQAYRAFEKEDLNEVGLLLFESWIAKKSISKLISNGYVDKIYNEAMVNGALGGKILGAGSSGFLFCICSNGKERQRLINAIGLPYIEPGFNFKGSEIILI